MSKALWCVYEEEIPDAFFDFLLSPEMKRIDHTGMHCGMEYTSFPFYMNFEKYSRYEHSLGVALILYHFTKDLKISLSGLFHDIATPAFAHVIDFLAGDHVKQEKTESRTRSIIENSQDIQKGLKKYNLSTDDVADYHLYPLADNDSPRLSSDRLEYTLNNFLNYNFAPMKKVKEFYQDLTISKNEEGIEELTFKTPGLAKEFTLLTLKNSHVYVTDEDRYGMEYLARILKKAIERNVLSIDDLYTTEENVIKKLTSDEEGKRDWLSFRSLHKVEREEEPSSPFSFKIDSKKRYIDPLVVNMGRVSSFDKEAKEKINEFLHTSFDIYLKKVD